jgi:large subunit ribosomal protein L24
MQDVRLVVPLRNEKTGKIKDTVVQHLRGGYGPGRGPLSEQGHDSSMPKHIRYIAGVGHPIPWPEVEEMEKSTKAADTQAEVVDALSVQVSLTEMPFPETLIDELRNKYSRTRSRHAPEYIQQKMKEDVEEEWRKRRRLVSPQQEYWERKAKQKEVQSNPQVTKETLHLIRDMQAANPSGTKDKIAS